MPRFIKYLIDLLTVTLVLATAVLMVGAFLLSIIIWPITTFLVVGTLVALGLLVSLFDESDIDL
jgi:uncharacterized membrane protein